jgi:GTP-binding protein EngB required for normal cell division
VTELNHLLAEQNAALPAELQAEIARLTDDVLTERPLRLILLGGFSVGKSSLLNMLAGQTYLFTAREEATSLPTFIEYGASSGMTLVGTDGSVLPLDADGFRRATSEAPAGAACATLALPLDWLRGVSVIDLPGLGSVSAQRQEYTAAQIQQADAILYLIEPRGPAKADLQILQTVRQYGKRVKVVVARWDEIDAAAARGEKLPDLQRWSEQIQQHAGVRVRLAGVSTRGDGRDEVLEFITRCRDDLAGIRLARLKAELLPLLQNALGSNANSQQACLVESEEEARALHTATVERKQALLAAKSTLYQNQQADMVKVAKDAEELTATQRHQLDRQLHQLAPDTGGSASWEAFGAGGTSVLRDALAALALQLSERSASYGELGLPATEVADFNLRLPAPEVVDTSSFLESGKLALLAQALEEQEATAQRVGDQLQQLQSVDADAEREAVHELLRQRHEVANEPLARIIERVEGNGAGQIGRFFGEVADIALMFVNPTTVGAKVGSLVGKGAKVAKVVVKTSKVAKVARETAKVVKAVRTGATHPSVPKPILEKLGALEVLSLGYWGERIGNAMGGAPTTREVIDPEDLARQQQALAELDSSISQARRELARKEDLENERDLTGWALEQSQKEKQRLNQEIARLTEQLRGREMAAASAAQEQHMRAVELAAKRAREGWLRSYDRQAVGMVSLLAARIDQYWQQYVETALAERLAELDTQMAQMQIAPELRQQRLAQLQREAEAMQSIVAGLA